MNKKKWFLVVFLCLFSFSFVQAKCKDGKCGGHKHKPMAIDKKDHLNVPMCDEPEMKMMMQKMHEERLDRLAKRLNLSDEQKSEIDEILKEGWEKIKDKKEKFREEVKTIKDENDNKIKDLLNEDQKLEFGKCLKEREKRYMKRKKKYKKECAKRMKKNMKKCCKKCCMMM
jgi:transketolase